MNKIKEAVEKAGGPRQVSKSIGVALSLVYHWQTGKRKITAERALGLSALTGGQFTPDELCERVDFSPARRRKQRGK